jgi:uncharacterized membrane protein YdjX (TVP38/TMEM64 family)
VGEQDLPAQPDDHPDRRRRLSRAVPGDGPAPAWRLRVAVLGVLLAAAVVVALTVERPGVPALRAWLHETGSGGWALLVLGVALALCTPVPRTALSLLLGAAAGFPAGLAVAVAAGLLGGVAGFTLSRRLGRDAVARLTGRWLARADRLLRDRGFLAVLTARVSPVPFWVVSYAAGLSSVRWVPHALGTALGVVPGSVLYVGIGASVLGWL